MWPAPLGRLRAFARGDTQPCPERVILQHTISG